MNLKIKSSWDEANMHLFSSKAHNNSKELIKRQDFSMQGKVEGDDFSRVVYVKGGVLSTEHRATSGEIIWNRGRYRWSCMYMYVYICSPPSLRAEENF